MQLYFGPRSGNSYRARLMLKLLGLDCAEIAIDITKGESHTPEYRRMNPRGTVPTLVDGDIVLWDSHAIIAYLARRYGTAWLPEDPAGMAQVALWMGVGQGEIQYGLMRARAFCLFNRPGDLPYLQDIGRQGLALMEGRLTGRDWLATERATVADISCYPYVALAPQGQVSLDPYDNVRAWTDRVRALPGFFEVPGL